VKLDGSKQTIILSVRHRQGDRAALCDCKPM
jgi:hypothetical protein